MENNLPKRKHPRLDHYDYSTAGAYFITICTQSRRCLLSRIVGRGLAPAEIQYTAFYEHVIRGREDYNEIAEYIVNNPKQWELEIYIQKNNCFHRYFNKATAAPMTDAAVNYSISWNLSV